MVILLLELSCDYLHLSRQIGQLGLWCPSPAVKIRISMSPCLHVSPSPAPVTTNMDPLQLKLWCGETHDTTLITLYRKGDININK